VTDIYNRRKKLAGDLGSMASPNRAAEPGMKKKNEENRQAESLEESLKALFGEERDLTDAELDEELDACGIDAVELQANAHKQLFDYSNHHYRTLDRDVPANLEKTYEHSDLRALRKKRKLSSGRRKIRR